MSHRRAKKIRKQLRATGIDTSAPVEYEIQVHSHLPKRYAGARPVTKAEWLPALEEELASATTEELKALTQCVIEQLKDKPDDEVVTYDSIMLYPYTVKKK